MDIFINTSTFLSSPIVPLETMNPNIIFFKNHEVTLVLVQANAIFSTLLETLS